MEYVTWTLRITTFSVEWVRVSFNILLLHFVLLLAVCVLSWVCVFWIVVVVGSWLVFILSRSAICACRLLNSFDRNLQRTSDWLHFINVALLKSFQFFNEFFLGHRQWCKVKVFNETSFSKVTWLNFSPSYFSQSVHASSPPSSTEHLFVKEAWTTFFQSHRSQFFVHRLACKLRIEVTTHEVWSPRRFYLHSFDFCPIDVREKFVPPYLFPSLRSCFWVFLQQPSDEVLTSFRNWQGKFDFFEFDSFSNFVFIVRVERREPTDHFIQ